jgi:hypothetical protein
VVATLEGLPAEVAPILTKPANSRDGAETAKIMAYYRSVDAELRKLEQALAAASKPLPNDQRQKELENGLARAAQPVPADPMLVRLRGDAVLSTKQLANKRLTAAQDLAWALINTPAFLFNR